ncbi:hypothetical protein B0H13DRAFT_1930953 [Mycena leptocephala]|nr:hypothetical protein B0H13DRAFT_1930953 [Mycena leptocephala]
MEMQGQFIARKPTSEYRNRYNVGGAALRVQDPGIICRLLSGTPVPVGRRGLWMNITPVQHGNKIKTTVGKEHPQHPQRRHHGMRPTQEGGIHQESTGAQQETRGREEPHEFEICVHTERSCRTGTGARVSERRTGNAMTITSRGMAKELAEMKGVTYPGRISDWWTEYGGMERARCEDLEQGGKNHNLLESEAKDWNDRVTRGRGQDRGMTTEFAESIKNPPARSKKPVGARSHINLKFAYGRIASRGGGGKSELEKY